MRRQRGPTESVVLNMPCAHIRSRRSWLRAYALALICRPSASSAAPQALQGSISFSCVTGGSHLRLRLDEPPPAICLSSSGLSNSARCARGVETTNCNLWKYEGRIGFTIYKVQFKSSARLRLAGEAEFISRLVFRAQGAGGS